VSAGFIAERFRDSLPQADPGIVKLGRGSRDWPTGLQSRLVQPMKPAGVLIPILERRAGLTVLLTRRSSGLRHHAGQVSFPGGSMEAGDPDIRHTALRETHEEVGIDPMHITVAGYLPPMPTITGFAVTPVVGLVMTDVRLTLDTREVEDAFEVPLAFLMDAGNEAWDERLIDNIPVPVVEFRYGGQRIWGATASMVLALRAALTV
jgi:8-oxo-dGTP pyrophosphatase MutT (NUDIX family)